MTGDNISMIKPCWQELEMPLGHVQDNGGLWLHSMSDEDRSQRNDMQKDPMMIKH